MAASFGRRSHIIVNPQQADAQQRRNRRAGHRRDGGRHLLPAIQNIDATLLVGGQRRTGKQHHHRDKTHHVTPGSRPFLATPLITIGSSSAIFAVASCSEIPSLAATRATCSSASTPRI